MSFLRNSWGIRVQWKKPCAILCRILLVPASKIKDRSQINSVHSRTSQTPSLLSLKRQKSPSRPMSGWTLSNKNSVYWESPSWWKLSMCPINCKDLWVSGGLTICLPYLLALILLGISSRQPSRDTIYPQGWWGWKQLSLWGWHKVQKLSPSICMPLTTSHGMHQNLWTLRRKR